MLAVEADVETVELRASKEHWKDILLCVTLTRPTYIQRKNWPKKWRTIKIKLTDTDMKTDYIRRPGLLAILSLSSEGDFYLSPHLPRQS